MILDGTLNLIGINSIASVEDNFVRGQPTSRSGLDFHGKLFSCVIHVVGCDHNMKMGFIAWAWLTLLVMTTKVSISIWQGKEPDVGVIWKYYT